MTLVFAPTTGENSSPERPVFDAAARAEMSSSLEMKYGTLEFSNYIRNYSPALFTAQFMS